MVLIYLIDFPKNEQWSKQEGGGGRYFSLPLSKYHNHFRVNQRSSFPPSFCRNVKEPRNEYLDEWEKQQNTYTYTYIYIYI